VLAAGTAASAAGRTDVGRVIEWMWDACVIALPLAFLVGVLRMRLHGAAGLASALDQLDSLPGDGDIASVLAGALGDPSLQLVYWLPESERYVDRDGRPAALPVGGERAVTPIELKGRRVGALIHDPLLLEEPGMVRAMGRTAALWLERARLEAERNARLIELRESRSRLVEAGDLERRRIERDLHDGAQQRLAGLLLQSKLRRRAGHEPVETELLLDDLEHGLAEALSELRALAAGILPPALSDHGLAAALEELAVRSPVPVVVDADGVGRVADRAEVAAYFVVAEALANVIKHANARRAMVRVIRQDGDVVVEVADDGVGGAPPEGGGGLRGLVDRVAALDGTLTWTSPAHGGTVLRAEIPCAS
jgi:signal transduction histidine kinase